MGNIVSSGSTCMCSFGVAPIPIVSGGKTMASGMPALNVSSLPTGTFGMCTTQTNPAVAAATAAALGVPTPAPCAPAFAGMWIPGDTMTLIGGRPALTNQCKLMCSFGGQISISQCDPKVTCKGC